MTDAEREKRNKDEKIQWLKNHIVNKDMEKPFVFISYKSDDWEIVLKDIVYRLVHDKGLNVYYDGDFDCHADSWIKQFPENMESEYCKGVIVFVDNKYATSYATLLELMNSQAVRAGIGSINENDDYGLPVIRIDLGKLNSKGIEGSKSTFLGERTDAEGNENTNCQKELDLFKELIGLITDEGKLKGFKWFNQLYKPEGSFKQSACFKIVTKILEELHLQEKPYYNNVINLNDICESIRNAVMSSSDDTENDVFSGLKADSPDVASAPTDASDVSVTPVPPVPSATPEPADKIKPNGLFGKLTVPYAKSKSAEQPGISDKTGNGDNTIADGIYIIEGSTCSARCRVENGQYTVLTGSLINSSSTASSAPKKLYQTYANIISDNKLTEDVQFSSSSTAVTFIKGGSTSGPATFRGLTPIKAELPASENDRDAATAPTNSIKAPEQLSEQSLSVPTKPKAGEQPDVSDKTGNGDNTTIADGIYIIEGSTCSARCRVENGQYTVLAGSLINSSSTASSAPKKFYQTYANIISDNKLMEDVQFKSSSTAVTFIKGRSTSGPATFRGLTPIKAELPASENDDTADSLPESNTESDNDSGITGGIYHIANKNNEYNAYCEYKDGVFKVLPGSKIKYATEKYKASLKGKYDTMTANVSNGIVTESVSFNSPSGAAGFIVGSSVNGKKLLTEQNLLTGEALSEYLK